MEDKKIYLIARLVFMLVHICLFGWLLCLTSHPFLTFIIVVLMEIISSIDKSIDRETDDIPG